MKPLLSSCFLVSGWITGPHYQTKPSSHHPHSLLFPISPERQIRFVLGMPGSETTSFFIYCRGFLHSFGNHFNWFSRVFCGRYTLRSIQRENPRANPHSFTSSIVEWLAVLVNGVTTSAFCVGGRQFTMPW
jgi:hypothetical protein